MSDDVETPATDRDVEDHAADLEPTVAAAADAEPAATSDDGNHAPGDDARVAGKRRRGWISLHAFAFALVLLSGALVVVASLHKLDEGALALLRVTWWISGAAVVIAVASVVVPRRRP